MNIFEYAVRNRLRFKYNGFIQTEDLWDLSVEELDAMFMNLQEQAESSEKKSLLSKKKKNIRLEVSLEIIKFVVEEKLETAKKRLEATAKKAQKEKILAIMESKQDESYKNMSLEELEALLKE